MKMMDVIVKHIAGEGLELQRKPIPEVGPGEVLIKIHKTAICGTDVHIYDWTDWSAAHVKPGQTIGHEYVGEIAELGEGVTGLKVGQLVSGEGHIGCNTCRNCRTGQIQWCEAPVGVGVDRDGCFAEYLCIPASNVIPVDDCLNEEVVSFFDAFGNATHTALRWDLVGEDVLITGAGPIGIMAVGICKFAGARRVVITDLNDYRLDLAKKMGADAAIKPADLEKTMKELGIKEGFDVGLEMSGAAPAFKQMVPALRNGAKVSLLGLFPGDLTIDMNTVICKGLDIQGIYGRKWDNWHQMSYMCQGGLDMTPVITHRYHYTEFQKGFDAMKSGMSGKVVLDWTTKK